MKLKAILIGMLLFVNLIFFLFVNPICIAKEAHIVFKDVTVQLTQTRPPVGTTTIREYRITAILQNTGDSDSVNITVKLSDPQPGLNATLIFKPETYSFSPNEEKTFVFENWPTSLSGDVPLNISFQPTAPNVLETQQNTGFYVYTLHVGNSDTKTSTPGFEVMIVFLATLILLLRRKRRR